VQLDGTFISKDDICKVVITGDQLVTKMYTLFFVWSSYHLAVARGTGSVFPELFTEECLCRFYSYNGDNKNNKNQLDPSHIQPLKEYVTHFFPEVTQPQAWKLMVIPKINDALQRPKPLLRRHRCN
jgi:hypothetical protein